MICREGGGQPEGMRFVMFPLPVAVPMEKEKERGGPVGKLAFGDQPSPALVQTLTDLPGDFHSLAQIPLGVDFRNAGLAVAQRDLRPFQTKPLSDLRSRCVA